MELGNAVVLMAIRGLIVKIEQFEKSLFITQHQRSTANQYRRYFGEIAEDISERACTNPVQVFAEELQNFVTALTDAGVKGQTVASFTK